MLVASGPTSALTFLLIEEEPVFTAAPCMPKPIACQPTRDRRVVRICVCVVCVAGRERMCFGIHQTHRSTIRVCCSFPPQVRANDRFAIAEVINLTGVEHRVWCVDQAFNDPLH